MTSCTLLYLCTDLINNHSRGQCFVWDIISRLPWFKSNSRTPPSLVFMFVNDFCLQHKTIDTYCVGQALMHIEAIC